jgi:serine phosphatase RsbU (regulator of sigma subunit)/Na+/proline symporter
MTLVAIVATISLFYFALLFGVAFYADQRCKSGKSIISNPYIYTLSLASVFSSWSFYGSVGRAATSGPDFLTFYLGISFVCFGFWFVLRKMVRIAKEQNIVSIADFIASRYGKSLSLGAIVTVLAVLAIAPYIALQLKAVAHTFDLLVAPPEALAQNVGNVISAQVPFTHTALVVALLLGLFGILFGARHLDAAERHEGLVAVVALQSLIKLVAFLAVGLFMTYGLFGGVTDIFGRFLSDFPERASLLLLGTEKIPFSKWFSLTLLGMLTILTMPRQFHIMVVENSDEKHIHTAIWGLPLYMYLLNLFVIPIALGGLILNGGDTGNADYFVLHTPLQAGQPWLAVFVFIGGLSAAAGMVMLSSLALSTMILNHLVMPVVLRFKLLQTRNISGLLLGIKRLGILAVIFLGFFCYRVLGESYTLVDIGSISFVAIAQFVPAMIGGLYWKRANLNGARIGLVLGFVVWVYTLLIPAFVRSGWLISDILETGPFGFGLLHPLNLFGLHGLDSWSHSLFWTYFFNLGAYLVIPLFSEQTNIEREQAVKFVDVFVKSKETGPRKRLTKSPTIAGFVELMSKFIGAKQAGTAIANYIEDKEIDAKGSLSEYDLPDLKRFTEKTLAGSVGAAPARIIVTNYLSAKGSELEDVFDIFGSVTIRHEASRKQLDVLHEAVRIVVSGVDLQTSLDHLLDLLTEQFKFDLCVIRILDEEKTILTVRSQTGMSSKHLGDSDRALNMETYVGETFLTNAIIVINDTDFLEKPVPAQMIHREGIKSFAHAPITIEGKPIGVISAFSRSIKGIFTEEFIEVFKNLAGQIGVAWRNALQTEKLIKAGEREREMQIARSIQLGLLPASTPDLRGISLAGRCVPASEVGGDYYDFLHRDKDVLDLVIADVSGHNVGAALIMAEVRTFIQAKAKDIPRTSETLCAINEFLYDDLSRAELFITMFYLKYFAETRELSFASAGHNPPLLWRAKSGTCENLDAEGLILGVKRGVVFEEKRVELQPDDLLLLYTDGIIEAEDAAGTLFGEEKLYDLLRDNHTLPPQQIIDILLGQVRMFTGNRSFDDDITLVVMKVEGTA